MKFRNWWLISNLLFFTCLTNAVGQELNCSVIVNADFVETSERSVFRSMEASFASFMNETKWTEDTYLAEERIKCNLIITIQSIPNTGTYEATVQIMSCLILQIEIGNSNLQRHKVSFLTKIHSHPTFLLSLHIMPTS